MRRRQSTPQFGKEWGQCREEKRRRSVPYVFAPLPAHTSAPKITKFQSPSFRCHGVPPFQTPTYRLLRGVLTPLPKIKQKQLAGPLVAVLGFGKKGRCMAEGGQQRGELHEMTLERRSEEINSRAPCSAQAGKKAAPSSRPSGFLLPSFVQIGCLATNVVSK